MGERLAVDPNDDQILYLASPANGLWRSRDGGATWAQVAAFPVTSTPDDIGLSFVTFGAGRAGAAAARRKPSSSGTPPALTCTSPPTPARPGN